MGRRGSYRVRLHFCVMCRTHRYSALEGRVCCFVRKREAGII